MALVQKRLLRLTTNPPPHGRHPLVSMIHSRNISLQSYIVTPKELSNALTKNIPTKLSTAPRIIPLCASWFLPNDPQRRTGLKVFKAKRIPSARFFDLDAVKDHESPYPHMLPTAEVFAKSMQDL